MHPLLIINSYPTLQKGFDYIIKNSTSNYLPYHNLNHCLTVMKNCYSGLMYDDIHSDDVKLNFLVAALFHDANHSGGLLTDEENVENAKLFLREFIKKTVPEPDLNLTLIDEIIDATQYPYKIETKELSQLQAIIRDADLMQIYEDDFITQHIMGLSKEMKISVYRIVVGIKEFLLSNSPITQWAKDKHESFWCYAEKRLDLLADIIIDEKIVE